MSIKILGIESPILGRAKFAPQQDGSSSKNPSDKSQLSLEAQLGKATLIKELNLPASATDAEVFYAYLEATEVQKTTTDFIPFGSGFPGGPSGMDHIMMALFILHNLKPKLASSLNKAESNKPVSELKLSRHSRKIITELGIKTCGKLAREADKFMAIFTFGDICLNEIRTELAKWVK